MTINQLTSVSGATIYTRKSVRELTFEGYNDPILEISAKVAVAETLERFAWFYGVTNTVFILILTVLRLSLSSLLMQLL